VVATKRARPDDGDVRLDSKRHKLNFGHQSSQGLNGLDGAAHDGDAPNSDSPAAAAANNLSQVAAGAVTTPKMGKGRDKANMLKKQISMAKRSGKVKTTMELIENLGIEPEQGVAAGRARLPPSTAAAVQNLVPEENKEELMNRFFQSQAGPEEEDEDSAVEIISRPGTAASSSTTNSVSQMSSRVNTPAPSAVAGGSGETEPTPTRQTVEEVLALLEPINPAEVLAEWEARQEDEEVEMEGLIPVLKPSLEITEQLITDLNEGELEHIGGVRDHAGEFKEWHEMVSRETLAGEMLHILPYSVID